MFYYLPTVELTAITGLNQYGSVQLNSSWSNNNNQLNLQARTFVTSPNQKFIVKLNWKLNNVETTLLTTSFVGLPDKSSLFESFLLKSQLITGNNYTFIFYLQNVNDQILLTANQVISV